MTRAARMLPSALLGVGGSLFLLAPVACGKNATPTPEPIVDAGRDAAKKDAAPFVDFDSGPTVDVGPGDDAGATACASERGWQVFHPFSGACTLAVAPPEKWADAMPAMRPCKNGQAKCTEMAIPGTGWMANYAFEPESGVFSLALDKSPLCRRMYAFRVPIAPDRLALAGALEVTSPPPAQGLPQPGNGDFLLLRSKLGGAGPAAIKSGWWPSHLDTSIPITAEFPNAMRTGNTVFAYETTYGVYDIVDLTTNTLVRTAHPPATIRQFGPNFAHAGDLWGTATYGQLGKAEVWRLDSSGTFSALIQKQGVSIWGVRTDGQTIFWVEESGNEADLFPQPLVEIWAAPFTKDKATLEATKRKLVDVSHMGHQVSVLQEAAAFDGYYVVETGEDDMVVVRGRDGAFQRITLADPWGAPSPSYVDATQVWFGHGGTGGNGGFARIELEPWP